MTDITYLLNGSFSSNSILSGAIPVLVGLVYRRSLTSGQRDVWLLPLWSLLANVWNATAFANSFFDPPSNHPYFSLIAIVQFTLLARVYRQQLKQAFGGDHRRPMIGLFSAIMLAGAIGIHGLMSINTTGLALMSFSALAFAATYLYQQLQTLEVRRLDRDPMFWLTVGVVFYFSGSFLLFISLGLLSSVLPYNDFHAVFNIHSGLTLFLNLMYTVALWIRPPR